MKRFIYLFVVIGLMFNSACTPLADINTEIDAQLNPIVGEATFTLTADDYTALDLPYGSFSSLDDAKAKLPAFLSEKYPVWGKGSSALVGYNLYIGKAFGVNDYTLTQADYTTSGSDLLGFKFDANPADYLGDILAANVSGAKEGDYAVANYFQYSGAVVIITPAVSFEENFDYGATAGDLTTISAGAWANHSGAANQLMYSTSSLAMTNYPTSDVGGSMMIDASGSEDVNSNIAAPVTSGTMYASTLINLSAVGDGTYFFHFMDDQWGYSARVGAKTDGSGGVLFGIGASSSSLTYGTTSFELNKTYLLVSSYNIDNGIANLYVLSNTEATEPNVAEATSTGNAGIAIERIGIRQGSGGPTATLDGIRVANTWSAIMTNDALDDIVLGDKTASKAFYTLKNGVWEEATSGLYALASDDYDAMGTAYGQPGHYNNFDSSMGVDDYITKFLGIKYPFAQDDDNMNVLYKYYSSSAHATLTKGNSYTVVNGVWTAYQSTISTTLQFGHDGTKWVPDNTIKYSLVGADYVYMAAQLDGNADFADLNLGNLASYGDFDYNWSEAQIITALGILADHINPSAEEGQKYTFVYLLYDGGLSSVSINLIKTNGVWVLNN